MQDLTRQCAAANKQAGNDRETLATVSARREAAIGRKAELEVRCASHQPEPEITALLIVFGDAEAAETASLEAHKAAQADLRTADADLATCGREEKTAWADLRAVRDTVVALSPRLLTAVHSSTDGISSQAGRLNRPTTNSADSTT